MGKMHNGSDPIKLNFGEDAQRAGTHYTDLWEKCTRNQNSFNLIMGKRHSGPDLLKLKYGENAQQAGFH